jgi:two-component sensor histidine kinase
MVMLIQRGRCIKYYLTMRSILLDHCKTVGNKERQMSLALVRTPANSSALDVAAEANHRIGNNLSLIAGLARQYASSIRKESRMMKSDEVGIILEEFGGRLDAVARLHRLLASGQQEPPINIADYLRDIAEAVISSLCVAGETELQFVSDPGCSLPPNEALSLGLIAGELVTNAVKYAHPTGVAGKVIVSCRGASGGNITIEISDHGVGVPEGVDPIKSEDFGFRLVRSLADQLGATIAFHSDCLGLRFVLHMPAALAT